ncbi:hypothetical protein EPN83_00320 [Patescibacteria group bacterium]|nr:MAG: hypothetical protein EPN83_00320 [Patescibacteria group bacterium]
MTPQRPLNRDRGFVFSDGVIWPVEPEPEEVPTREEWKWVKLVGQLSLLLRHLPREILATVRSKEWRRWFRVGPPGPYRYSFTEAWSKWRKIRRKHRHRMQRYRAKRQLCLRWGALTLTMQRAKVMPHGTPYEVRESGLRSAGLQTLLLRNLAWGTGGDIAGWLQNTLRFSAVLLLRVVTLPVRGIAIVANAILWVTEHIRRWRARTSHNYRRTINCAAGAWRTALASFRNFWRRKARSARHGRLRLALLALRLWRRQIVPAGAATGKIIRDSLWWFAGLMFAVVMIVITIAVGAARTAARSVVKAGSTFTTSLLGEMKRLWTRVPKPKKPRRVAFALLVLALGVWLVRQIPYGKLAGSLSSVPSWSKAILFFLLGLWLFLLLGALGLWVLVAIFRKRKEYWRATTDYFSSGKRSFSFLKITALATLVLFALWKVGEKIFSKEKMESTAPIAVQPASLSRKFEGNPRDRWRGRDRDSILVLLKAPEDSILAEIAACESGFNHWADSAHTRVTANPQSGAMGAFQIMPRWRRTADSLTAADGLDYNIETLDGNTRFAKWLYRNTKGGWGHWRESAPCWLGHELPGQAVAVPVRFTAGEFRDSLVIGPRAGSNWSEPVELIAPLMFDFPEERRRAFWVLTPSGRERKVEILSDVRLPYEVGPWRFRSDSPDSIVRIRVTRRLPTSPVAM